jgi:hypothetical protein
MLILNDDERIFVGIDLFRLLENFWFLWIILFYLLDDAGINSGEE